MSTPITTSNGTYEAEITQDALGQLTMSITDTCSGQMVNTMISNTTGGYCTSGYEDRSGFTEIHDKTIYHKSWPDFVWAIDQFMDKIYKLSEMFDIIDPSMLSYEQADYILMSTVHHDCRYKRRFCGLLKEYHPDITWYKELNKDDGVQ